MRPIVAFLLADLLLSVRLCAAPTKAISDATSRLPDGLGVNIHFTDARPGEMEMLAAAGFRWVRMDFSWGAIERQKGKYDFAAYDRLLSALDDHHIRAILILDYSNRFYDDDLSPHTDEGRRAFADWAAASVTHFKNRGVLWEMYNEPNISFWRPKPNVEDYAKLAIAVGKAIRQAAPDELYIGPACSTMDFRFLEECFKAGCLEYWSAVSVHPYRQKDPETAATDYRRLRRLISRYTPRGKQVPIVSGEWGYSSGWKTFDDEKQGRSLPRELLINVASGVPISIWYDWHDDGTNPKEPEHHFGTVHHEYHEGQSPVYEPKPAYIAMQSLSTALSGCTFEKRLELGNEDDWILIFHGRDGMRLAVWTTGHPHDVTIPIWPGSFNVTGHTGQALGRASADAPGLKIRLSDAPQYLAPVAR